MKGIRRDVFGTESENSIRKDLTRILGGMFTRPMITRQLVLITRKGGAVTPYSLALVRKLKEERLLQTLSSVTRESPCWSHRSAFLVTKDVTNSTIGVIRDHQKIVDILRAAADP